MPSRLPNKNLQSTLSRAPLPEVKSSYLPDFNGIFEKIYIDFRQFKIKVSALLSTFRATYDACHDDASSNDYRLTSELYPKNEREQKLSHELSENEKSQLSDYLQDYQALEACVNTDEGVTKENLKDHLGKMNRIRLENILLKTPCFLAFLKTLDSAYPFATHANLRYMDMAEATIQFMRQLDQHYKKLLQVSGLGDSQENLRNILGALTQDNLIAYQLTYPEEKTSGKTSAAFCPKAGFRGFKIALIHYLESQQKELLGTSEENLALNSTHGILKTWYLQIIKEIRNSNDLLSLKAYIQKSMNFFVRGGDGDSKERACAYMIQISAAIANLQFVAERCQILRPIEEPLPKRSQKDMSNRQSQGLLRSMQPVKAAVAINRSTQQEEIQAATASVSVKRLAQEFLEAKVDASTTTINAPGANSGSSFATRKGPKNQFITTVATRVDAKTSISIRRRP